LPWEGLEECSQGVAKSITDDEEFQIILPQSTIEGSFGE